MTLSRRRFLTISAAFAATPALASTRSWTGRAFGADVGLTFRGPQAATGEAMEATINLIREIEGVFSLYDDTSEVSWLNETGGLTEPSAHMLAVLEASDKAHRMTEGRFDPTVQTLWNALAKGSGVQDAAALMGWPAVQIGAGAVRLGPGQALSFNGIAQGYATDKVTTRLHDLGLRDVLVNMGEHRADKGPWRLALQDPDHGVLGLRILTNGALATSSARAMRIGGRSHILHPLLEPKWSTVSVEANTAMLADSLSTALVLADDEDIRSVVAQHPEVRRATLVSFDGDLTTI